MNRKIKLSIALLLTAIMILGSAITVFAGELLATKDVNEIKGLFKGYTNDAIPYFVEDAKANGVTLMAFNSVGLGTGSAYDICVYVSDSATPYLVGHANYVYVEKPAGEYAEIVAEFYDIDMAQLKVIKDTYK